MASVWPVQRTWPATGLARLGTVDDIANSVRFLLGEDSSWITGQCISTDGGHHLRRGPNLTPLMELVMGPDAHPH